MAGKKVLKKIAKKTAGRKQAMVRKPSRQARGRTAPQKKPPAGRMPGLRGLNVQQAAAVIGAHLSRSGHDAILTGRACAAIYGGNSIKVDALEFAITDFEMGAVEEAMAAIGFMPEDHHAYASRRSDFEVALSPQPVAVGEEAVAGVREMKTAKGMLKMLTPTDCVRQRLSMYYRFGDREALVDAVKVARRQKVDLDLVRRWSEWEWCTDKFEEFARSIQQ